METQAVHRDERSETTKPCPFCAEQILKDAIKCRFCGEFLNKPPQSKVKWYHATATVVLALLFVGPLALPLVWFNPRYKPAIKIVVTIGIIALTVLLCQASVIAYNNFMDQFKQLGL
ncbi:MAG: hypothetical protein JW860_12130 [Sedimentisphaerales bacterium]|nr:hypothetical protein [Sedimentisphaerales bacterium]